MFTDPQTVTISGTAIPLPRTSTDGADATYRAADGLTSLRARHFYNNKKVRDEFRINVSKTIPDPTQPALNREVGGVVMIAFEFSNTGYTAADKKAIFDGAIGQLNASSAAVLLKLLGGES
jgi:hypothetical protein